MAKSSSSRGGSRASAAAAARPQTLAGSGTVPVSEPKVVFKKVGDVAVKQVTSERNVSLAELRAVSKSYGEKIARLQAAKDAVDADIGALEKL